VAVFNAYAGELLELSPDPPEYEALVTSTMVIHVCEMIAGWEGPHLWKANLWNTWLLFDHPSHSALQQSATEIIDALDGPVSRYWHVFVVSLHKAISRRVDYWLDRRAAAGDPPRRERAADTVPKATVANGSVATLGQPAAVTTGDQTGKPTQGRLPSRGADAEGALSRPDDLESLKAASKTK